MRRSSITIAALSTLLATTILSDNVAAQKGVTLQPQTAWAVQDVKQNGVFQYCALARRFEQGLILTFAQNQSQEMSLALDFMHGKFSTAKDYRISFDPGAGQQRHYSVRPSSGKAFVVKVGRDDGFVQALRETGYLRVNLNGESFSFNLADIDLGKTQIDTCLASNIMPAGGTATGISGAVQPVVAQANDTQRQLEKEKSDLLSHVQSLENENERLRLGIAEYKNKSYMAPKAVSPSIPVPAKIPQLPSVDLETQERSIRARYEGQIASLRRENESIKRMAETLRSQSSAEKRNLFKGFEDENQNLQQKISSLNAQMQKEERRVIELNGKLMTLMRDNEDLVSKLQKRSSDIMSLRNEVARMQQENVALKNDQGAEMQIIALQGELRSKTIEANALREEVTRLKQLELQVVGRIERIRQDNKVLEGQLSLDKNHDQIIASLKKTIEELKFENRKISHESSQKNAEIAKISEIHEKGSDRLKAQGDNLSKELFVLRSEKALVQQENEMLVKQAKNYQQLEEQYNHAQIEIKTLRKENVLLKANIDNTIRSDDSGHKDRVADLLSKNSALHIQISDLSEKLIGMQQEREMISENLSHAAQSARRVEILEKENASLRDKIEELEAVGAISQGEVISLRDENKNLRENVQKLENDLRALREHASLVQKKSHQSLPKAEMEQKTVDTSPVALARVEPASGSDQNAQKQEERTADISEVVERVATEPKAADVESQAQFFEQRLRDDLTSNNDIATQSAEVKTELETEAVEAPQKTIESDRLERGHSIDDFAVQDFDPEPVEMRGIENIPEKDVSNIEIEEITEEEFAVNSEKTLDAEKSIERQGGVDIVPSDVYQPAIMIEEVLKRASLMPVMPINFVESASNGAQVSYQWHSSEGMYGSAQQKPIEVSEYFDEYVQDYLEQTQSRCSGDFAVMPINSSGYGDQARVDRYDIACIGDDVDSSASLVFFAKDGTFTALSHETATETMDAAMAARDKVADIIEKS